MSGLEVLPQRFARLSDWLRRELHADHISIESMEKLTGGAIQENWLLELSIAGGARNGKQRWVLRTGAPSTLTASHGRVEEFAILSLAWKIGVKTPEPIAVCPDKAVIGDDFLIVGWVPGVAQGRRIVRDPALAQFGPAVAVELGSQLATIHSIVPPADQLGFLGTPPVDPALARIARYRSNLDELGESRPGLEFALNWLEDNTPPKGPIVLCHADFRTGNYLVQNGALTAILDWEFAEWSDANEDIGWFCARCWRFGRNTNEAGGIANRDDFYRGYERRSGRSIDPAAVFYWEVMAQLRWAIIALQQESRHLSGREPSLELALTGWMVPEIEHGLLAQIGERLMEPAP